jgi:hypothetical protein
MKFKLDPIKRFALFLSVFAAVALGYNWGSASVLHLGLTLGFGLLLYAFYTRFSSKRKNIWDTVVTCLLIFLVLHPAGGLPALVYPVLATVTAITLKFFVEWKNSPIINPAATGILISAGLGAIVGWDLPFASWWGASFWVVNFWGVELPISLLLMAVWIFGGFAVWRKFPLVVSFLAVFAVLHYLRTDAEALRFTFMDSFIYFFACIMLAEPKTSPFLPWKQVAYGAMAAGIFGIFAQFSLPYPELFALIGANLVSAGFKWEPAFKQTATT